MTNEEMEAALMALLASEYDKAKLEISGEEPSAVKAMKEAVLEMWENMTIKACRGCGAPIIWVAMPSGKRNPMDARPDQNGLWVLRGETAERFDAEKHGDMRRYTSHYATCPDAASFRKGK